MQKWCTSEFTDSLAKSLREGVDIGIRESESKLNFSGFPRNPPSTPETFAGLSKILLKWHSKSQILGPFSKKEAARRNLIVNPIHGVPKPDGSVRPVINNSYPKRQYHLSVNGHIIEPLKTVQYPSLRSIVTNIDREGKGAWVWSRDLEDGYFNCIVKEQQCRFLAFEWADRVWIPTVMVFGLSSAPPNIHPVYVRSNESHKNGK